MSEQYWKDRADALERERDALAAGLDRDTRSRYQLIDRLNALERALRQTKARLKRGWTDAAMRELDAALTDQPATLEEQGHKARGEPLADQPADAGETSKGVGLRQQISDAQEQVAAWPEWMTKSAKVHEAPCCARAREDERERCARVADKRAKVGIGDTGGRNE
jgi:hypothetical protein